ncbi:MAG: hypothetical protein HY725_00650 [Candidatus Rokubacteria bacterium]|nr:hypothetical protein [Candidatus Rokubacteria bacterium]
MRFMRLGSVALSVAMGIALLALGPAQAQVKIPPDFAFEKGKESPGPVTFSHEKHKEKAEKCTVCHTKVFKMKKGTTGALTMAAMKEGKLCGTCHNGKTEMGGKVVFAVDAKENCENCHKKQ